MKPERFPRGLGIAIAIAGVALVVAGVAVPSATPSYARQKPAFDVTKIGVESEVAHSHAPGIEGEMAHIAEHARVEASVFASPGGRYNAEDVARNGTVAPAKRFEGIVSAHDMHSEPGTRICPITRTKANERFVWWVDGQRYTFCCPPCVEEWVMRAKTSRTPLPPPESFVAK